jgi:hypothetical protein
MMGEAMMGFAKQEDSLNPIINWFLGNKFSPMRYFFNFPSSVNLNDKFFNNSALDEIKKLAFVKLVLAFIYVA